MKKLTQKQKSLILPMILMSLCVLLIIGLIVKRNFPIIKVGQTWEYTVYNDNPFEKKIIYTYVIVDIKDGYIRYIENGKDTTSSRESMFRMNTIVKK